MHKCIYWFKFQKYQKIFIMGLKDTVLIYMYPKFHACSINRSISIEFLNKLCSGVKFTFCAHMQGSITYFCAWDRKFFLKMCLQNVCMQNVKSRPRLQSRAQPHPPPPPPPSPTILGVKNFRRTQKASEKIQNTNFAHFSRNLRFGPAPGYNFPHPHLYFVLFCAPGSHFTHPHLFHLSFPHPRSRRKVPYSAVWIKT